MSARDVDALTIYIDRDTGNHVAFPETDKVPHRYYERLTTIPIAVVRKGLAAAGHAIEQDWQPIETAPRDGTRFIAWWQPGAQLPNGGWHECQWAGGGWYHPFFTEPTHWKPPPVDGPHLAAAKEPQA